MSLYSFPHCCISLTSPDIIKVEEFCANVRATKHCRPWKSSNKAVEVLSRLYDCVRFSIWPGHVYD